MEVATPSVLALVQLISFLWQAPWNPNGIHDGIMYPAAIRVADGGVPNSDAFTQYGPFVMLVQGWWLHITDLSLLSLRYLTALFLAAIGVILYLILKNFLTTRVSFIISILWALSAPKLLPTLLPWSSVLSTLLILASVLLFLGQEKSKNRNFAKQKLFVSGLCISLAVLVRTHVLLLPTLLLLIYFANRRNRLQTKKLRYWFIGILGGIIITIFYFVSTKSFIEYWDQCIAWAVTRFALNTEPLSHQRVIAFLSSGMILMVGTVGIIGIRIQYKKLFSKPTLKFRLFSSIYTVSCITLSILAIARHRIDPGRSSFHNSRFVLMWVAENFLQIGLYISLVLSLSYYLKVLFKKYPRPQEVNDSYLFAVGITALSQLYPSPDQLHLWWISPLLIILIARNIDSVTYAREYLSSKQFNLTAIILICLLVVQLQLDARQQTYRYSNSSLLGMTSSEKNAPAVDRTMLLLARIVPPRSMGVICEEGIYSASGMKYLAENAYFLDTHTRFQLNSFKGQYIFACNLDPTELTKFIATPGFHIRFKVILPDNLVNALIERSLSN